MSGKLAYRVGLWGGLVGTLLLAWLSMGVGIIGADGDRHNIWFVILAAVGLLAAVVVRLRAASLRNVALGMALGVALIGSLAILSGWGMPYSPPTEIVFLCSAFVFGYLGVAWFMSQSQT